MSVQNAAPPASRENEAAAMMCDDDTTSRDSGICDMDDGAPTCFSALNAASNDSKTSSASNSTTSYVVMECEEQDEAVVKAKAVQQADTQKVEFRRKSSVRRLFKSPSSSDLASPGLTVRPANMQHRKRSYEAANGVVPVSFTAVAPSSVVPSVPFESPRIPTNGKKRRIRESSRSSDHYHLEHMETDGDDEDQPELMELCEAVEQQSTSGGASPSPFKFVAPAPGPLVPMQSLPRFLSDSSFFTAPRVEQEEIADDKQYEEPYNEATAHLVVDYQLETIASHCSTSYRRISAETLCKEMQQEDFNEKYLLVDCRYPYEYKEGHIKHAINYFDRDNVSNFFFNNHGDRKHNRVPIFYCEYSQKRGPSMAYALRADDRKKNEVIYPRCAYEEMYVLDKGYKNFFQKLSECNLVSKYCFPTSYVTMDDLLYARELKKYNFHRKATVGQSILRAESFHALPMQSSSSQSFAAPANPSARCDDKENRTPANPRVPMARRQLNFDAFNSPTNYHRPVPMGTEPQTPSPSKCRQPLRPPQFT